MRLSATSVLKYETCPQQYYLEEVLRIRSAHQAANLVFGGVMHGVVEAWLRGWLQGQILDPVARFDRDWQTAREAGEIEYASTQSPESLAETGRALAVRFAAAWPGFDRLPALDERGEPLIERKLEARLGPDLVYVGKPDLVAVDADGRLACLDLKTPSAPTDPDWLESADQLTGYQWLLDAHADRLGIPPVERLGLLELVKRKVTPKGKGPEVCAPITTPRRPPARLDEYAQKVQWVAEDIDRGRFPRRGLMAHNSPCGLCAVKGLCQRGDVAGLILPAAEPAVARAA